ncbi:hypothetical protein G6F55_004703 [Rhizopus delemar]|nr:hypothetical protein G6F55_004703 [Rhizopus delemar]
MFSHRPLSIGINLILSISVYAFLSQKIELLDQNATGQLNQTELGEWAMKKFNLDQQLAQQTISNILKNAETLYSNINVVNNGKSLKTTHYPQLDDEVVKFVADMNNNNLPVNRDLILRCVRPIASVKYRILENEILFSSGWLTRLFKRIEVKCRPMHGESVSVDITSESIQNELRKIEELLGPYDPANIMNFDETGIIDKFKAHFRAQQYDRALCLYITNTWLKVKPETINRMLPDFPRKFDNKVTVVSQLKFEADESEMIVCYTTSTTNNEETAERNIDEAEENDNTEQDEQRVDIVECKKRLREAYETIFMYEALLDDLDRKLHRRIRMRLADSCAELDKSKEQTDVRSYFTK